MSSKRIVVILLLILSGCGGGISAYKVGDYDSLMKSGWSKYNQNKFEEAQQLFLEAKAMNDERAEAYIGCGWSLLMRQHPDSALVEFFNAFDYITTLNDTVDIACGISGSYLANGDNNRVICRQQTPSRIRLRQSITPNSFVIEVHTFDRNLSRWRERKWWRWKQPREPDVVILATENKRYYGTIARGIRNLGYDVRIKQGHPVINDIQKEIRELGGHGILIELAQDLTEAQVRKIGSVFV